MRPAVLAIVLSLVAVRAQASPLELFGAGGRSPALGATGVAAADDVDCIYLNPAGLADIHDKRLRLGTLFGTFNLDGIPRPIDDAVGIEIGGALGLPLGGVMRNRVGIGIALYVPSQVLNRARAPTPGTPFYVLLENRSQSVGIQLGFGVRLSEDLSAGFGVIALATLKGGINVAPDAAGRFTTTSEQQIITGFAPIFGARWRVLPRFTLGATVRFVSQAPYDIVITNSLGDALPITLPVLRVAGVAQYDPLAAVAEAAWRPTDGLLVTGGLAYERWSAFPLPTENVLAGAPAQEPPGFHDTVQPRVGVELSALAGVALRAGYAFVPTPAPDATGAQAFIDNNRHVITAGIGLSAPPIHVDAWGQAHLLAPRHTDRPNGQPAVDSGGTIWVGGMLLGIDL
jgi:long-chain fatty acid transport protein